MDINYLGGISFKIKTKTANIVINPTSSKIEADIVLYSAKNDNSNLEKVSGYKKVISTAGEYEISGVSMMAFKDEGNVIHMIEADGLRLVHLGEIGKELKSEVIDEIGATDILMVPVSNNFNSVEKIDPFFIIPMNFEAGGLDDFIKNQGFNVEKMPKLSVKKEDITEELQTKIIELGK